MNKKAANPIDKYIGSRVRMRRLMLNMSQERLGDAIGLTFQQVQKYEKGTNRIGASRLQQISDVLQVEPSFFFEGAPSEGAKSPIPDYVQEFICTSDGIALMRSFMRLEAGLRRMFVALIEKIADEQDEQAHRGHA